MKVGLQKFLLDRRLSHVPASCGDVVLEVIMMVVAMAVITVVLVPLVARVVPMVVLLLVVHGGVK